jgi:hypothetical protein
MPCHYPEATTDSGGVGVNFELKQVENYVSANVRPKPRRFMFSLVGKGNRAPPFPAGYSATWAGRGSAALDGKQGH